MRTFQILMFVILGIGIIGCGSANDEPEVSWLSYGGEITKPEVITVAQAINTLDDLAGETVVIEGVIKDVCQSRGCWMVVEENGKTIRVRFQDYGFFVPWESAGKTVRMQGVLSTEIVSEERARHWAEEETDPVVKPEDIHGDQEVIMFMATAVNIKEGLEISEEQRAKIGDTGDHEHTH